MPKAKFKLPIERPGIKVYNPEDDYDFEDEEIGWGKLSKVVKVTKKKKVDNDGNKIPDENGGKTFAAKCIKYDSATVHLAVREYDMMLEGGKPEWPVHEGLVKLHDAYIVRKYLILILELVDGKTLFEFAAAKESWTENDVAVIIKQLLQVVKSLHDKNFLHLDIRPSNIRLPSLNTLKLVDYNSCRYCPNRAAGVVVDLLGDSEFCAPELLDFGKSLPSSDIWSVGVIAYILMTGESPFYKFVQGADTDDTENKTETLIAQNVKKAVYTLLKDVAGFSGTIHANDFVNSCLQPNPLNRGKGIELAAKGSFTCADALNHPWFSDELAAQRKNIVLDISVITDTNERLMEEELETYVEASFVYRTFEEEENITPESEEE